MENCEWKGLVEDLLKAVQEQIYREKNTLKKYAERISGRPVADLSAFFTQPPVVSKEPAIMEALFQQKSRRLTDHIICYENLKEIIKTAQTGKKLIMTKAISYPSKLRLGNSTEIMDAESVWIIDLFTRGVEFKNVLGDNADFFVINTAVYEGLNRLTDEEFIKILTNLPEENPGGTLISRYFSIIRKSQYLFIQKNEIIRDEYSYAISKTFNLTAPINVRSIMRTQPYIEALNRLLAKKDPLEIFTKKHNSHIRDFSAFVFAEEIALKKLFGVNIYLGPLREELGIGIRLLDFYKRCKVIHTPAVWYTRPSKIPEITFADKKEAVYSTLQNPVVKNYVLENLIRAGRIENTIRNISALEIFHSFCELIEEIKTNISYAESSLWEM